MKIDLTPTGFTASRTNKTNEAVAVENHPNPFSETTQLHIYLKNPGKAELSIFDATGMEVQNSDLGYLNSGMHNATLSADLSPGVYFYFIRIGGIQSKTMKMVVQ